MSRWVISVEQSEVSVVPDDFVPVIKVSSVVETPIVVLLFILQVLLEGVDRLQFVVLNQRIQALLDVLRLHSLEVFVHILIMLSLS